MEAIEAARLAYQSLQAQSVVLETTSGSLMVDGVTLDPGAPGVVDLVRAFRTHRLRAVSLGAGTSNEELRHLATALASPEGLFPDSIEWAALMGEAALRVTVVHEREEDAPRPAGEAQAAADEPSPFAGLRMLDLGQLDLPAPAAPEVPAPRAAEEPPPFPRDPVLPRLKARARAAQESGSVLAVLEVAKEFLDAELAARTAGSAPVYRAELRRLVTRRHMIEFARMAATGDYRELATEVLYGLGAEVAHVLMDELVKTESRSERRIFFSLLSRMPAAAEVVLSHLAHPSWFVVRNAADLCGEMRLSAAAPALGRLVRHSEPRVRRSVAAALLRIATPDTVESLGQALRDPDPAIRASVLAGLDAERARSLSTRIVGLLSREEDAAVQRALIGVLARMDTAEARQALQRVADGQFRNLTALRSEAAQRLSRASHPGQSVEG